MEKPFHPTLERFHPQGRNPRYRMVFTLPMAFETRHAEPFARLVISALEAAHKGAGIKKDPETGDVEVSLTGKPRGQKRSPESYIYEMDWLTRERARLLERETNRHLMRRGDYLALIYHYVINPSRNRKAELRAKDRMAYPLHHFEAGLQQKDNTTYIAIAYPNEMTLNQIARLNLVFSNAVASGLEPHGFELPEKTQELITNKKSGKVIVLGYGLPIPKGLLRPEKARDLSEFWDHVNEQLEKSALVSRLRMRYMKL